MTRVHSLLLFLTCLSFAIGGRILFVCLDHYGHIGAMLNVGKAVKGKGHDVYAIVLKKYAPLVEEYGLKGLIQADKPSWDVDKEMKAKYDDIILEGGLNPSTNQLKETLDYTNIVTEYLTSHAVAVIENKQLYSEIESLKFDLAVVDGIPMNYGAYIIPYKLGIPYVTFTSILLDPWLIRLPSLPSVEPTMMFADNGNKMSFSKRIKNFITMCLIKGGNFITYPNEDFVSKYAPNRPHKTIFDIYKDSEMFLVNQNIFFLEYQRVESTNVRFVGSIVGRSAKRLPDELEKFMSSARHGVVLVSFGSVFEKYPLVIVEKLFAAFSHFKESFLMRYFGKLDLVPPENVRLEAWIPQNDLLGHPKIKLFITHSGYFGQIEGFYHRVPMLMVPFSSDQPYNARRAEEKGYGKILDITKTSSDEVEALIREMLNNSTYKENLEKAKAVLDTFPRPEDQAAFWIDHVYRFGSRHLKPSYMDMPLYQYFMLDILAVFAIFGLIVLLLCYCCFVKIFRCKSKPKSKSKSD